MPKVAWKDIERVLLVLGVLGALVSSATGETAEHLVKVNRQILNMHSLFAGISISTYAALLAGEVLVFLTPFLARYTYLNSIRNTLTSIQKLLTSRFISSTLSIIGLVAISLTGLLGGILVYGTTADPFAKVILQLLHIQ